MPHFKNVITSIPAVFVALLPQLFCPACWPAYTSILSSIGIGFINYSPFLLPVTIFFLIVALAGIVYKAQSRNDYAPFIVGLLAAIGIVVSKFLIEMQMALYLSTLLLLAASVWNIWPRKDAACATN